MEWKKRRNAVLSLYPEALCRTYCVPPIHFNHVPYTRDTVAGQPVLVLHKVPDFVAFSASRPAELHATSAGASLPVSTIPTGSSPTSSTSSVVDTDTCLSSLPTRTIVNLASSQHLTSVSQSVVLCPSNCTATSCTGKNAVGSGPEAGENVCAKDSSRDASQETSALTISDTACDVHSISHTSTSSRPNDFVSNHSKTATYFRSPVNSTAVFSQASTTSHTGVTDHSSHVNSSTSASPQLTVSHSTDVTVKDNTLRCAAPQRPKALSPISTEHSCNPCQKQKRSKAARRQGISSKRQGPTHNSTSAASAPAPTYSLWAPQSAKDTNSKPAVVQFNDVQEDFAQNHVLLNLQELGNSLGDAMFILSQYSFDDYLKKASKCKVDETLPRPADFETKYRRGDFDILIIHRKLGILLGEIKSVGWNVEIKSSQLEADEDVAMRMEKAVEQLEKSDTVIRRILHDVLPELSVKKTLILPYVSQVDVQQVLSHRPALKDMVCKTLAIPNDSSDVSQLCCCSDQLTDPTAFWNVTRDVLKRLETWWHNVWKNSPDDSQMDDEQYLEIVGRFVGPASSVRIYCAIPPRLEVRTQGEAVSELGRRLSLLVLTPHQIDLLDRAKPRVCVSGPPGTGKTVVITVMGLKWLLDGNDVHVLSTRPASLAASRVVFYQLEMTRKTFQNSARTGSVLFHQFDFYCESQVDTALSVLSAVARDGQLYVLMEEAVFSDSGSVLGPNYLKFIRHLLAYVPGLHLWVARVRHDKIPGELEKEILTTPLRSAPVVLREVRPGVEKNNVHNYSDDLGVAAPSDGPRVARLSHSGPSHQGVWPHQCVQCGRQVALFLRQLHVGSSTKPTKNSPYPLRYKDVFILTRNSDLQDDVITQGAVTSTASGLVQGLREEDIPVCVLEESPRNEAEQWMRKVMDTAEARKDQVTVAHWRPVLGLERKLVVWLKGRTEKDDKNRDDEEVEMWDRLWIASRCTSQLVIVDMPPR